MSTFPQPMDYVALGDSYAAGVGAADGGQALAGLTRTDGGYPVTVAARLGLDLAFEAANGSSTLDVTERQLGRLGATTRLVTLTVGGNDAGFTHVLTACAQPAWLSDGMAAIETARTFVRTQLPERVARLLADIRGRAPQAALVMTGYPLIFGEIDCSPWTFFDTGELHALNAASSELVDTLAAAAAAAATVTRQGGFRGGDSTHGAGSSSDVDSQTGVGGAGRVEFIDVRPPFAGHELCAPDPWVHNLTWPLHDSFHPTSAGHQAYADAVTTAAGTLLSEPLSAQAAAAGGADSSGVDDVRVGGVRGYGAGVSGVRVDGAPAPEVPIVGLPDLTTPAALAAAAGHGLDPDHVRQLARRAGLDGTRRAARALGHDIGGGSGHRLGQGLLPTSMPTATATPTPSELDALAQLHDLDHQVRGRSH